MHDFDVFNECVTDRPTDQPTDKRTQPIIEMRGRIKKVSNLTTLFSHFNRMCKKFGKNIKAQKPHFLMAQ